MTAVLPDSYSVRPPAKQDAGAVFGKGDHRQLDLDLVATDPVVESYLLDRIVRRSIELAREYGHSSVHLDAVAYQADEPRRERLAADGFTLATTFHRMRRDHQGPVEAPSAPAGVTVRRGAPDDASRRVAHAVLNKTSRGSSASRHGRTTSGTRRRRTSRPSTGRS